MNNVITYLEKLGLSDLEAKLYITLLQTGPVTVRDLAKKADIGRTTSYPYIDLLLEKGLIMKIVKGVHTLVSAVSPEESLNQIVEEKTKTITEIKDEFPEVVKVLKSSISTTSVGEAEIRYYQGELGIKKIYQEALRSHELRSYVNFEYGIVFPGIQEMFFDVFEKNPNFVMYELLADTPVARKQISLHPTRYFRKFIPPHVKMSTADNLIYDGKVSIINLDNKVVGTVLQNSDYYTNAKSMFDFVWQLI